MAVINMEGVYISCRPGAGPGHDWDEIPVIKRPSFGVAIWWRCTKCTSERRYIYSPHDGRILSRQYRHPKDWMKLRRDEFSGDDIRLLFLRERRREQAQLRKAKRQ